MPEVVTLMEVFDRLEAEIIKEALEAKGINATLFQESVGSLYPGSFGVMNKVEICVPEEQLELAKRWLEEYESGTFKSETLTSDDSDDAEDEVVEDPDQD